MKKGKARNELCASCCFLKYGKRMTANRQSSVSVCVVHGHLRGSFTEVGSRSQGNSAPEFLDSQWPCSSAMAITVNTTQTVHSPDTSSVYKLLVFCCTTVLRMNQATSTNLLKGKYCPTCKKPLERIPRTLLMKMIASSKHFICDRCHQNFFSFFGRLFNVT